MPAPSEQPKPNFDFAEPISRNPPTPEAFKQSPPGSLVKYQPPPPTPIYPQPINRPSSVPSPSSPSSIPSPPPRSPRRSGGRIAGGFKMPITSGAAARVGAGVVARRIPYVALAFAAYDAYQLACSFQLIPGSICPRPDNPSPGGEGQGFEGGQCCDNYYYTYTQTRDQFGVWGAEARRPERLGRVLGMFKEVNPDFTRWFYVVERCDGSRVEVNTISGSSPNLAARVTRVEPSRGQADNCGNPQPIPQPQRMPDQINNVVNINRNININISIPAPKSPSPQPKTAPRIIYPPSPIPNININFGDNYFGGGEEDDPDFEINFNFNPAPRGNFEDYPDIFNNFPPAPSPNLTTPNPTPTLNPAPAPAPAPAPRPELPPPIPITLPPDASESDKYNFRQGKETLDKLYRANAEILEIQRTLNKHGKILENLQSLIDLEVEGEQLIKRCDDIEIFYSYKEKVLRAINKQLDHVKQIEQTIITEVCNVESSNVVAAPDWWQVRLNGDTPQLALVFRASGTRTYHKLTVPHPLNTNKLTSPPIESYTKGNWQGEIVCIDNSKFLVNAVSKVEAERIVDLVLTLIDPIFSGQTPRLYFAERKGVAVSTGGMRATSAMFFPFGQQQTIPAWRVSFKQF